MSHDTVQYVTQILSTLFQEAQCLLCMEIHKILTFATSPVEAPLTRSDLEAGWCTLSQTTKENMLSICQVIIKLGYFLLNTDWPGECLSNDPVAAGEAEYRPWSGPFGSARPIRGLGYRTLICRVEPEWDKAVLRMERELQESLEHSNDTYDTCPAPWLPTREVTCSVSHSFTFQQPQNVPGIGSKIIILNVVTFLPRRNHSRNTVFYSKSGASLV